jgi:predicted N-acetyltransferase YhbS
MTGTNSTLTSNPVADALKAAYEHLNQLAYGGFGHDGVIPRHYKRTWGTTLKVISQLQCTAGLARLAMQLYPETPIGMYQSKPDLLSKAYPSDPQPSPRVGTLQLMKSAAAASPPPRRRKSPIRVSTKDDIEAIRQWLEQEEAAAIRDNFLRNWSLTLKAHQEHRLIVYVDPVSDVAVGYQWGGLLEPGILQVRSDMRRRGIGRKLVAHRIAQAKRKDEGLLFIQCKPETSIPFWLSMGFKLLESSDEGGAYAYQVLEKTLELPPCGKPVDVSIRFYPEEAKWRTDTQPVTAATPAAMVYADGTIRLAKRVHLFSRLYPDARDVVVEIVVNGEVRYRNKAKYDETTLIGVQRCSNGYFIDRIVTPKPRSSA